MIRKLKSVRIQLPGTPESRGRFIGAVLGITGFVYITAHVLRYLQLI